MENRRRFLKNGLGAAASAAALWTFHPGLLHAEGPCPDYVMIIDLNKCNGCESCVIACKERNRTAAGFFLTRVHTLETGRYPAPETHFFPAQCNQCEEPPCAAACQEKAVYRLENGVVFTDWNRCKGLGACMDACPYEARVLDPRHGNRSDKCDFCMDRLERGLLPACVEHCPPGARMFGDRRLPSGVFAEYLQRTDLFSARPELGMKTHVLYVPVKKGRVK